VPEPRVIVLLLDQQQLVIGPFLPSCLCLNDSTPPSLFDPLNGPIIFVYLCKRCRIGQTAAGHRPDNIHTTNDDGSYQTGNDVPSTRFLDNGDGTVTDNMTGLMWVKNANAIGTLHSGFDADGRVTWQNALTFVSEVNNGTYDCGITSVYTDWRLPTVCELKILTNYSQSAPYTWLKNHGFTAVFFLLIN